MLVSATSGGVASGCSKVLTYPLEIAKVRLMSKAPEESARDVLARIHREGWFTGCSSKVSKNFTQKFVYFYLYEGLLQGYRRLFGPPGTAGLLGVGYLAEALGIPAFVPVEYVMVQVQTSADGEGALDVARRTLRKSGLAGFYRGWTVYLLCALQPSIQFTIVERVRRALLGDSTRPLTTRQAFWLGALSKAVASTLTYPINVGRVVMQARKATGEENGLDSTNVFAVLRRIAEREGVGGLYKGLFNELSEGLVSAAILLAVKEQITASVRAVVLSVLGQQLPKSARVRSLLTSRCGKAFQ